MSTHLQALRTAARSRPYFPALDGLRAVCVLLVMTSHVRQGWAEARPGLFDVLHGALGVSVFFVLSGFLITLLCLREESETGGVDFRAFYLRRAFRLFPLYYLVLGVYVALVLVLHLDPRRAAFRQALPYYMTYLQELPHFFGNGTAPFEISWSLGIEEKFYVVWPALAFALTHGVTRRFGVAAGVLALTLGAAPALGAPVNVIAVFRDYGVIGLGCALALVVFDDRTRGAVAGLARGWVPLVAIAAVALSRGDVLVVGVATALALPALVVQAGRVSGALACGPLVWLGQRSYGVYLVHQLTLGIARKFVRVPAGDANEFLTFVVGLALTIPVVAVLYRAVERPLIGVGRRLGQRRARAAATPDVPLASMPASVPSV